MSPVPLLFNVKPRSLPPLSSQKRGISPLIATVLLLAFAVAIGTMVVSYMIDATRTDDCGGVRVALEAAAHACYSDGHVTFILSNKGDKAITSALIRFINLNKEVTEHDIPFNPEVASASATKVSVPLDAVYPEGVTVTVIPRIIANKAEKACTDKGLELTLAKC